MRFFEWRNDEVVRNSCISPEPVRLDSHKRWFELMLRNKELFVVMYGPSRIIGHARVEKLGQVVAAWHIYLNPAMRGKKLGTGKSARKASHIFSQTLLQYINTKLKIPRVVGDILVHNIASIRFHEDAGFEFLENGSNQLLRYLYIGDR
jgi:RimJ/RimL family protein N-acetyltransferase